MQQMLTALERVKRDLPSYWSGPYTSAYLARIDETYKKAKRNLQNIEAIQKSLRYVAHQTERTEREIQQTMDEVFRDKTVKPEQLVLIEHKF